MKNQNTFHSITTLARLALTSSVALAMLLPPRVAAADERAASSAGIASVDPRFNDVARGSEPRQGAYAFDGSDQSGWSLNFTPVLLAPQNDYHLGGGVDPEVKYSLDRGGVRLSAGLRVAGYYAKNLFGITAMPTLRMVVPVGAVEPYVSFGMGYGWLPKIEHSGVATLSRLGVVFRFSKSFGLGVEGTIQKIDESKFSFPSFGSAVAINL